MTPKIVRWISHTLHLSPLQELVCGIRDRNLDSFTNSIIDPSRPV